MLNTEILYSALKNPEVNAIKKEGYCKICGKSILECYSGKDAISNSFTNFSECKKINSNMICKECYWCLKDESLRYNNFIADKDNILLFNKNGLEDYLFNLHKYVNGEFVIGVTTSFKKHNSFRCKVNLNTDIFYIRQEDKEYKFNTLELQPLYVLLNESYLQFSKEELLSGIYKMISIEQFGLDKFKEYESIFKKYRKSAQFELLVYMMNSEKRNEYMQNKIKENKEKKYVEK